MLPFNRLDSYPRSKLPEFTHEVRDCDHRKLGQHTRRAMRIIDGPRWHAGCLFDGYEPIEVKDQEERDHQEISTK